MTYVFLVGNLLYRGYMTYGFLVGSLLYRDYMTYWFSVGTLLYGDYMPSSLLRTRKIISWLWQPQPTNYRDWVFVAGCIVLGS